MIERRLRLVESGLGQRGGHSNGSEQLQTRDKAAGPEARLKKIRIAAEGLKGEASVAGLCRREGIAPALCWRIGIMNRLPKWKGKQKNLTLWLRYCIVRLMETKEDLIKETIHALLRVAKMYARIEEMPIPLNDDREVTTREAHTIQAIGENEPMTVTMLAGYFGITKSAASQMVSKLVKKKFIMKNQSVQSAKEYELSLTPLGWLAFRAHEQFHGRDMADLVARLSGFSLSQIATLSVMLEAIGSLMDRRLAKQSGE